MPIHSSTLNLVALCPGTKPSSPPCGFLYHVDLELAGALTSARCLSSVLANHPKRNRGKTPPLTTHLAANGIPQIAGGVDNDRNSGPALFGKPPDVLVDPWRLLLRVGKDGGVWLGREFAIERHQIHGRRLDAGAKAYDPEVHHSLSVNHWCILCVDGQRHALMR